MPEVLTAKHKAALGAYKDSRRRAADMEARIAKRAAVLEKELMAEGESLSEKLKHYTNVFDRRRLEKRYLKAMHSLGAVRRAISMSRASREKLAKDATPIKKGLAALFVRLAKSVIKAHTRRLASGQVVQVAAHEDKRTLH